MLAAFVRPCRNIEIGGAGGHDGEGCNAEDERLFHRHRYGIFGCWVRWHHSTNAYMFFSTMRSHPLGWSSVPWSFGGSLPWPFRGGSLPWPAGGAVLCFGPWACANAERTRRIRPRAVIRPASSTSCGAIHGAIAKSLLGMTCCRAGVGKTLLLDATRMRAVDQ